MEPFEKLEIILQGTISEKNKEIERAKAGGEHPAYPYVQGLEHELIGLERARSAMCQIKNGGYSVSDGAIEKLWKPKIKS